MYWLNLRGLKWQLMQGSLPQPMAFRYAAAYATFSAVAMIPGLGVNRWDVWGDATEETTMAEAAVGMLFLVIAYWRIGWHIRSVASSSPPATANLV